MPIIQHSELPEFAIPPKDPRRLRIADSHEFVDLYRGDKDLHVGKIFCRRYNCEIVQLGSDISSPADSRFFRSEKYPYQEIKDLPENYYLLLLKSRLIFHRRGNISLGGFFRWTPSLGKELLRWRPDLIFENPYLTLTPRSYMTHIVSKMLKIPLVYLDAGDIIPLLSLKHKLSMIAEKPVVNSAAAIITYNEAGKQRFINKYDYPSEKIYVIPKPIETSRFDPNLACDDFKRKFELNDKFVVSYFGRLCSNKGPQYLLRAAEILNRRGLDSKITFLFAGGNVEPEDAAGFKNLLNSLNLPNVRLTGKIANSDIPQAYAASDIAVYPDVTNLPGFSTVLAESMAAGLPIVIGIKGWESAVPLVDNQTGLLIEPRNSEQIADRIELLINNPDLRGRLSSSVINYARQYMDYDKVVAKYYELFCNLTNRKAYAESPDNKYADIAV
jgi:glycosyltransferase involved in cell wall biosynthesis